MTKQRRPVLLWSLLLVGVLVAAYSTLTNATDFSWVSLGNNSVFINNQTVDLNGTVRVNGSVVCTVASGCGATGTGTVTQVNTGTGLTGGPITTTGTVSIASTGISAGTYGDGTHVPQCTYNAQGQATSCTNVSISGSGSGNVTTSNNLKGWPAAFSNTSNSDLVILNLTCAAGYALNTVSNSSICVQFVQPSRTISTSSPLQGGGTLTADLTLSILQAGAAQNGYLSSTDWNTFNNKGTSNLTLTQIANNIGNWSGNQSLYTLQTFSNGIATNLTSVNSTVTTNSGKIAGLYTNVTNINSTLQSNINGVQANVTSVNSTVTALVTSNTTTNNRIDNLNTTKGATGNCGSLFLQNITATGVQCYSVSGSGTVTSVGVSITNTSAVTVQNSPVTGAGTINLNFQNASSSLDGILRSVDFSLFLGYYTNITALQTGKGTSNVSISGTVGQPLFYQSSTSATTRLINSTDLNSTNSASGGQCLTYGSNGQYTWASCGTGGGGGSGNATTNTGTANSLAIYTNSTNIAPALLNASMINASNTQTNNAYPAWNTSSSEFYWQPQARITICAGSSTTIFAPSAVTSVLNCTIPANTLQAGDQLVATAIYEQNNNGSATPLRVAAQLGTQQIMFPATGSTADTAIIETVTLGVTNSSNFRAFVNAQRSNSAFLAPTYGNYTLDLTTDQIYQWQGYFNGGAGGASFSIVSYSVEVIKAK